MRKPLLQQAASDPDVRRSDGHGGGKTTTDGHTEEVSQNGGDSDSVFQKHGNVWTLTFEGRSTNLSDMYGLRYIHRLIEEGCSENEKGIHVFNLVTTVKGADLGGLQAGTDSGPVMDVEALLKAQVRIKEIDSEIQDDSLDPSSVVALREEREQLERQIRSATGLSGRMRILNDQIEKARVNVQKRIRHAIKKIGEHLPALSQHLQVSVITGATCRYAPKLLPTWKL